MRISIKLQTLILSIITLCLLFTNNSANAQQKTALYSIVNKNDTVGNMTFTQTQTGNMLLLKVASTVQTKGFMSINVLVNEESRFENGRLQFSSVNRSMNDKMKTTKTTVAFADGYRNGQDTDAQLITKQPIIFNVSMLYVKEPVNLPQIYSDNYQQFVPVETASPHVYKVTLPDGNFNVYYYANGVCSKVDVHNNMYNMQMLLQK